MLEKLRSIHLRPTVLFLMGSMAVVLTTSVLLRHRVRQAEERELRAKQLRLPDTLRVVTLSGATTFFLYRDEPMGYQYELVRLFAQRYKLPLKLYVTHSVEEAETMVEEGKVDLCITPHAVTHSARERFLFAGPESLSALVLIQRTPKLSDSVPYIPDVAALLGKEITVMSGSRAMERVKRLEEQLGGRIPMHQLTTDTLDAEDLIAQVAHREINYTIADEELAKLSKTYYPQLDISVEVGFAQRLRWFVSPQAIGLAQLLDQWAKNIPTDKSFHEIYKRYFELSKADDESDLPAKSSAQPATSPREEKQATLHH